MDICKGYESRESVIVRDGRSYLVIAGEGKGKWAGLRPFAVMVSPDGKACGLRRIPFSPARSLASDPVAHKVLLWHNERKGHGGYVCFYFSHLLMDGKVVGGARVLGYQWSFAPMNYMWCAVVWDGKNFVGVVEQFVQRRSDDPPSRVELAATRISPTDGKPLDVPFWDKKGKPKDSWVRETARKNKPVIVASEKGVQLRHPALASLGEGKSLLVYSRRGGIGKFKINGVILSSE